MKRNMEIKATLHDWDQAEREAQALCHNVPPVQLSQIDTYFHASDGRLKLREISGMENRAELIHYRRPNLHGPKKSEYSTCPVEDVDSLKSLLSQALGVQTVVMKRRRVYFYQTIRIHLDRVEGLGAFLELEAVLSDTDDEAEAHAQVNTLLARLGISPDDLIQGSYSEMMQSRERPPH